MQATVALAEDDSLIAEIYTSFLEEAGYIVHHVPNGKALLDVLNTEQIDLIVLDIMMPEMTGYEVLQKRQTDSALQAIPVIVLTGLNAQEEVQKITDLGADDYFDKTTVELEPLLGKIEQSLQA